MRVIDKNRRATARADELEPALGAFKVFQRWKHRIGLAAGRDDQPGSNQRIFDLEFTDQRQAHLIVLAAEFEPQLLRKTVDGGLNEPDTGAGCLAPNAHDR